MSDINFNKLRSEHNEIRKNSVAFKGINFNFSKSWFVGIVRMCNKPFQLKTRVACFSSFENIRWLKTLISNSSHYPWIKQSYPKRIFTMQICFNIHSPSFYSHMDTILFIAPLMAFLCLKKMTWWKSADDDESSKNQSSFHFPSPTP